MLAMLGAVASGGVTPVLYAGKKLRTIEMYDYNANLIKSVEVGIYSSAMINHIEIDRDNGDLYVFADYHGSDYVLRLDKELNEIWSVKVGYAKPKIAILGDCVYVIDDNDDLIKKYRKSDGGYVSSITPPKKPMSLASYEPSDYLYVGCENGYLYRYNSSDALKRTGSYSNRTIESLAGVTSYLYVGSNSKTARMGVSFTSDVLLKDSGAGNISSDPNNYRVAVAGSDQSVRLYTGTTLTATGTGFANYTVLGSCVDSKGNFFGCTTNRPILGFDITGAQFFTSVDLGDYYCVACSEI